MFRPKQIKPKTKKEDTGMPKGPTTKMTLKCMALTLNKALRCQVKRPRYARMIQIIFDSHPKVMKVLNRVKTMRLLTFKLISYKVEPEYKGELTQLLSKTHYLRTFHFLYYLPRNKDFQTVRKLILKQKNLQHLALLNNWGEMSSFKKINDPDVQMRMIHYVGKNLRRLVLTNVLDSNVGYHFRPQYLPNLKTFIFGTTCNDIYECFPCYNGQTHGKLVQKLLRMPTLRQLNVRTCENFTDQSFWKVFGEGVAERNEPICIDIGGGIWGYYDEDDGDYADEYEKELRNNIGALKPGQVFKYSSSWNVLKIQGKEKDSQNPQKKIK